MKSLLTPALLEAAVACAGRHWPNDREKRLLQFVHWLASDLAKSPCPTDVALAARLEELMDFGTPPTAALLDSFASAPEAKHVAP